MEKLWTTKGKQIVTKKMWCGDCYWMLSYSFL